MLLFSQRCVQFSESNERHPLDLPGPEPDGLFGRVCADVSAEEDELGAIKG